MDLSKTWAFFSISDFINSAIQIQNFRWPSKSIKLKLGQHGSHVVAFITAAFTVDPKRTLNYDEGNCGVHFHRAGYLSNQCIWGPPMGKAPLDTCFTSVKLFFWLILDMDCVLQRSIWTLIPPPNRPCMEVSPHICYGCRRHTSSWARRTRETKAEGGRAGISQ